MEELKMKKRKMIKKVVSVLLVSMLVLACLTGCETESVSGTEEKETIDEGLRKELADGMAKLEAKNRYIINNQLSAPDGSSSFVEVIKDGDSCTEYLVEDTEKQDDTEEKNKDALTPKDYQYTLQDWCCLDNSAYIYVDGKWYKYPNGYGEFLQGRKSMYANILIPALTSLKKLDKKESADIGDGTEEFTIYVGTCHADTVKDILGISTKVVYDKLVEQYENDEKYKNEVHLARLYLADLAKTLTTSDATLEFALDKDGVLRELNMTVSGLGTKLKYFRAVSLNAEYNDVEKPKELSSDIPSIIETLTESAEFAKDYDNYDDMVMAYQDKVSTENTENNTAEGIEDLVDDSKVQETEKPTKTKKPKATKEPESADE